MDDFVILHKSKAVLQQYEAQICEFLQSIGLELHPQKCKILSIGRGVSLLGFRRFYHYKLVRQRNLRKIIVKLQSAVNSYELGQISAYEVQEILCAWNAYAIHGSTYALRQKLLQNLETELKKRTVVGVNGLF